MVLLCRLGLLALVAESHIVELLGVDAVAVGQHGFAEFGHVYVDYFAALGAPEVCVRCEVDVVACLFVVNRDGADSMFLGERIQYIIYGRAREVGIECGVDSLIDLVGGGVYMMRHEVFDHRYAGGGDLQTIVFQIFACRHLIFQFIVLPFRGLVGGCLCAIRGPRRGYV